MVHALRGSERLGSDGAAQPCLSFPPFRLDTVNEQLWLGQQRIALKPLAFRLLRYLAERSQRLVSKQELLATLWADTRVSDSVLKTQVNELRRLLGDESRTPRFIETVHRRGYRFIAAVEREAPEAAAPEAPEAPALEATTPEATLPLGAEPVPAAAAATVFVGRAAELSRLHGLWEQARQGQRRLVLITGEPGIGKTTLLSQFIDAHPADTPCWSARGQCVEQYGPGEAYLPFLEAFGRLCRGADGAPVLDVLRSTAPTWLMQLSESLERASASGSGPSSGAVSPERMLREMAEAVPVLTAHRPLLLALEDLQWADHSTLSLISYLAQRSDPARLLILGTYRSRDVRSSDHPLWSLLQLLDSRGHAEELALGHLDETEVNAYLSARFPQRDFPAALSGELCGLTAGNPLFLSRVVDVLLKRGLIQSRGSHWQFLGAMSSLTDVVPDRLVMLIAGETDRLTPFERSVLDAAAVAGFEFSVAALAAALDREVIEIEDVCVRWLREDRFFKRSAGAPRPNEPLRCEFFHALYRQVLYQRLAPTRRMQLHLRLGQYEETLQPSQPQSSLGLLALHFRLGGDSRRATRYGLLAGEHALRRSAYREAIAHLRTALETLAQSSDAEARGDEEVTLLIALSVPLLMTQGYAATEVEHVYLRAKALCEKFGSPLQALQIIGGMALLYLVRGNLTLANEMGERLLALAEAHGDPDLCFDAHVALGLPSYFIGDLASAERHLRPALARHPRHKHLSRASAFHPSPYLLGLCYWAKTLWMLGYPDQALAQAEEALALARQLADPFSLACVLTHVIFVYRYRGDAIEFERTDELVALGPGDEFGFYGPYAAYLQGSSTFRKGHVERGIEAIRQGWGAMHQAGIRVSTSGCLIDLATAYLAAGRFVEAFAELHAAFEVSQSGPERYALAEIYRIYGEACRVAPAGTNGAPSSPGALALGPEAAFSQALATARSTGAKSLELRAAISLGRLWLSQGRVAAARSLVGDVLAGFTEGHDTADPRAARALLDELEATRRLGA